MTRTPLADPAALPPGAPADDDSKPDAPGLGRRLALGAGVAVAMAVPFTLLAVLVLAKFEPLQELDHGTANRLHAVVLGRPGLATFLEHVSTWAHPNVMRVLGFGLAAVLLGSRRFRLAAWLAVTMAVGGLLDPFLKDLVHRSRPVFPEPITTAPGYSFPSGHALNSMLLAAAVMVLAHGRVRPAAYRLLGVAAVALVLLTGFDRIALGVHYVSDVLAGWVVALMTVAATTVAFTTWQHQHPSGAGRVDDVLDVPAGADAPPGFDRSRTGDHHGDGLLGGGHDEAGAPVPEHTTTIADQAPAEGSGPGAPRVALVLNPVKVDDADALRDTVTRLCAQAGSAEPLVLETSKDDPGAGAARQAVDHGCDLVLVAGGDGTVRCVAQVLTGTQVRLGLVPSGTGNLLARNLGLPLQTDPALDIAFGGVPERLDVGRLDDGTVFTIMAGIGFDAAMMREAPEGLKAKVGWPAYIVGGIRGMRRARVRATVQVDDRPPVSSRVRTVLVANLGQLQGGLQLLPDADPHDGLLDIGIIAPRRPGDWAVLVWRGIRRSSRTDHRREVLRGRRVEVRVHRTEPRQVDGDLVGDGLRLVAEIVPQALTVMTAPPDGDAAAGTSR